MREDFADSLLLLGEKRREEKKEGGAGGEYLERCGPEDMHKDRDPPKLLSVIALQIDNCACAVLIPC